MSGRGLAIAGILIGLLVSGGQAAGGLAAYRFFKGAGTIIDEQMPAFAADFNEGNDRAIYDRCGQAMKDSTSFEDFQATMELARRKWGRMEMMGFWKMFTSGGVERHVDLTGGKQTVKFPANFSKAGTQQVQIVLLPERGQLKLVGIGFVGLTDDAGDGDGNNVEID